jgi:hypothetical protein
MWFKDNVPIFPGYMENDHVSATSDGLLHISHVQLSDAADYTCRALNNIGSATRSFTLVVNVPVHIEDNTKVENVSAVVGTSVELKCVATGSPQPTVQWLLDHTAIVSDFNHFQQTEQGLTIKNIQQEDAGSYKCEAQNGFGHRQQKLFVIEVLDVLSVTVKTANETSQPIEGQTVVLLCHSNSSGKIGFSWTKDGNRLPSEDRIRETGHGELLISDVTTSDSGTYGCTVTRGHDTASSSIELDVKGSAVPESCVDKPWYANCDLILQANLCGHPYFSIFCCRSCYIAGRLP